MSVTASLIDQPHGVGVGPGLGGLSGWLVAGLAVLVVGLVAGWASRRGPR